MTYPAVSQSAPFYRPKKLPRVLRRQAPVLLLCGVVVIIGLLAMAVTWRNLTFERLTWDVGHNRTQIEALNKEIIHISGQIELESSYTRIAKWASGQRGWDVVKDRNQVLVIPETVLTPGGYKEAQSIGKIKSE